MQTQMSYDLWESTQQNWAMNQRMPKVYTKIYPALRNMKHVHTNSTNFLTISSFSHVISQTILSKLFKQAKAGILSLM